MKTLRNTSIITLAVVALALLVAAPVAMADSVTYTSNTIPNTTSTSSNMGTLALEQFNPSLGTLQSVDITLYGGGTVFFTAALTANGGTGGATLTINSLSDTLTLKAAGASVPVNLALTGTYTPSSAIVITAVTPPQPVVNTPVVTIPSSNISSGLLTDSTDLTDFSGLGNVDLTLSGSDFTTYSGNLTGTGYLASVGSTSTGGGDATVTYNYIGQPGNTPEPGTLSLFGTGLLGLAGMLRYRFGKAR
jgi:hypothetical protein